MSWFPYNGRKIHYIDEGAGAPLLFVHGLGGNAENWLRQRADFSTTHRVITPDLPGHGRSDGHGVPFSAYWEYLLALCDHLGIESVSICGLSKGARAALMLACRRPHRIRNLIVVNAFTHLKDEDASKRRRLYDRILDPDEGRAWADALLKEMGVLQHRAIVSGFRQSLSKIDRRHIWQRFQELVAYDQRPELAGIDCRVLLVKGGKDLFIPDYCMDEMRSLIPRSTLVRLPECGHLPYLESPVDFNAIVRSFLLQEEPHEIGA